MMHPDRGLGRTTIRFFCALLTLACASDAAAQLNERDRLERCANNRARIAALQASWPAGEAGWSDENILRARRAIQSFPRQQREVVRLAREASTTAGPTYNEAMRIVHRMGQVASAFDIICYPFTAECASVYIATLEQKIRTAEAARPRRAAIQEQIARHQTNLVALGCDRVAGARDGAGNASAAAWMTGTFDSSFGTLTLSPGGGSYDYYGGQVQVSSVQGDVMEGIWTQTRAGRQCPDGRYYGRFRFTFSPGGFSGSFGYCDEEPGAGPWNGTRR